MSEAHEMSTSEEDVNDDIFHDHSQANASCFSHLENSYDELCAHLPKVANFTVPCSFSAETSDHEDHLFCGIMFSLVAKPAKYIPVHFIEIQSLWIRGGLGDISVYYTPDTHHGKALQKDQWLQVYQKTHSPSYRELIELRLHTPIRLVPGVGIGLYVHSTAEGDQAIVYGEKHANITHEDPLLRILPGMAHIGNEPFSRYGMWGYGWREPRQFVGRISYGVKYNLWRPNVHYSFPQSFRRAVVNLLLIHNRDDSQLALIPKDLLFYIINRCSYDWFGALTEEEKDIDHENLRETMPFRRRYYY